MLKSFVFMVKKGIFTQLLLVFRALKNPCRNGGRIDKGFVEMLTFTGGPYYMNMFTAHCCVQLY